MQKKVIIIGAGITGLTAGWKLSEAGYQVRVCEQNDFLGGMSATFRYKDYSLDYGPHKIFTVLDDVMQEIRGLFSNQELLSVKKKSRVRLGGQYMSFPLGIKDIFMGLGLVQGLRCGLGYGVSLLKQLLNPKAAASYEDWVVSKFGRPIYNLVLGPYAQKVWGNPQTLSRELAESRIAAPNLLEMVKQMVFGQKKNAPIINAETFFYPIAGISALSEKMADKIKNNHGAIVVKKKLTQIQVDKNSDVVQLVFADCTTETLGPHDVVLSTMPLDHLVSALPSSVTGAAQDAVKSLKTRNLILFYLALNQERIIEDNWLFFPEKQYTFNRIFEQKAFNAAMLPKDRTVLCLEITCAETDALWRMSDEELFNVLKPQLKEAGLLDAEVAEYFTKRLDHAYPVYDIAYREHLHTVLGALNQVRNLYTIGRQGGFSYTGMADSMDIGIKTALFLAGERNKERDWLEHCEHEYYNYVVVD